MTRDAHLALASAAGRRNGMTRRDLIESATRVLMRDFGYEYDDRTRTIWQLPIWRFSPKTYHGHAPSQFAAAEELIRIIKDDRYYDRLHRIRNRE